MFCVSSHSLDPQPSPTILLVWTIGGQEQGKGLVLQARPTLTVLVVAVVEVGQARACETRKGHGDQDRERGTGTRYTSVVTCITYIMQSLSK